jgi:hypothetical protein
MTVRRGVTEVTLRPGGSLLLPDLAHSIVHDLVGLSAVVAAT